MNETNNTYRYLIQNIEHKNEKSLTIRGSATILRTSQKLHHLLPTMCCQALTAEPPKTPPFIPHRVNLFQLSRHRSFSLAGSLGRDVTNAFGRHVWAVWDSADCRPAPPPPRRVVSEISAPPPPVAPPSPVAFPTSVKAKISACFRFRPRMPDMSLVARLESVASGRVQG